MKITPSSAAPPSSAPPCPAPEEFDRFEAYARERQEVLLGRLLSGAVHDFGNILNAMGGFVHLAARARDTAQLPMLLDKAREAGRNGAQHIDAFKAVLGRDPLIMQKSSVATAIETVLALSSYTMKKECVAVLTRLEATPEFFFYRLRLHQAVLHLLFAALVRLRGRDRKRLEIDLRRESTEVLLSVTDNGFPPPDSLRSSLFETRLPAPAEWALCPEEARDLRLSRAVALLHGGEMNIAAGTGEGLTATLRLPYRAMPPEPYTPLRA